MDDMRALWSENILKAASTFRRSDIHTYSNNRLKKSTRTTHQMCGGNTVLWQTPHNGTKRKAPGPADIYIRSAQEARDFGD